MELTRTTQDYPGIEFSRISDPLDEIFCFPGTFARFQYFLDFEDLIFHYYSLQFIGVEFALDRFAI